MFGTSFHQPSTFSFTQILTNYSGNWRRETPAGVGSLLTKSCHDIDFIMWLLCSPPPSEHPATTPTAPPHLPKTISSTGHLSYFRRSRKPIAAGKATNCLSCPAEPTCIYSTKKIYIDRHIYKERDTGWPLKIIAPEIEDTFNHRGWDGAEKLVLSKLAEDYAPSTPDSKIKERSWYGRCVYESDNDVCDDQLVTMTWDDESVPSGATGKTPILPHRAAKTAIFHMTAQTQRQCERYGQVSGSLGHLSYDGTTITAHSFATDETQTWTPPRPNAKEQGHGGGDDGLARQFVSAVEAVEAGAMEAEEANKSFLGVTLEECVRSHAVVFAAEQSRMGGGGVIDWGKWFGENWRD
jgi:predicted dehydrogenase